MIMARMTGQVGMLERGLPLRLPWRWWPRYRRETLRPLHSLLFLLPLVALYEFGLWASREGARTPELLAYSRIQGVLAWFGLVGPWVPAAVLIATLLIWHRLRGDRWQVRGWVLLGMVAECAVLMVPLLVLSALFQQGAGFGQAGVGIRLVRAVGAGIYEELVFRLFLLGALLWLLAEFLEMRDLSAAALAIGLGAVLFAACHFQPIGSDRFLWSRFWFRAAAGAYLGIVFLGRGMGVASGTHAAYNAMLVLWHTASD